VAARSAARRDHFRRRDPDTADYAVVLEPSDLVIGSVNEDFAIESLQGDIFQLGNTSWRVLRVEQGKVRGGGCARAAAVDSVLAG
jgi:Lhr-like helicase